MEKQKECFRCKAIKPLTEFYKHPAMSDGTVNKCKECNKVDNKDNWWKHRETKREYDFNRHHFSIDRIFDHRYNLIKAKCEGRIDRKYTVKGMDYLTKDEWLGWCKEKSNLNVFMKIYSAWVKSNFNRKLCPSIDRIDNNQSYVLGNLQWLTLSENCKKHKT